MNAKIFSHEKLIGTAKLQVGDESMGCLYGNLIPTDDYFKFFQKTVWQFNSARQKDHVGWQSLKISVQLDNGCFIFARGGFTFDDIRDLPGEPIRIDIAGIDRYIIDDFLLPIEPKPFLLDPWETISIEQKIAFEKELLKEIGDNTLSEFEKCALCKFGSNDDVLFRIHKSGSEKQFAVVHLTWIQKKEQHGFPKARFFDSFDDFKQLRMYPDNADWEQF